MMTIKRVVVNSPLEVRARWNSWENWNTPSGAEVEEKAIFLNDMAERVYTITFMTNVTENKGAEGQPGQP
jgi:hypothetical protein